MRIRNLSIKRKIILITMLTSGIALLIACAGLVVYDVVAFRSTMVSNLSVLLKVIGDNSSGALVFNDSDSAEEILSDLSAQRHITLACIYAIDGRVFARYHRSDLMGHGCPPGTLKYGYRFGDNHLQMIQAITLDDENIGMIFIQSDLEELYSRLANFGGIVLVILFFALLVAFWMSSRLQRVITQPIFSLVETAKTVSAEKDYSVRTGRHNDDEIGLLIDNFNNMLANIQTRDVQIRQSEERYRNLVEGSIQGILINSERDVLFANQAFADLYGYESPEELYELDDLWATVAPEERARLLEYHRSRIKGEKVPQQYEFQGMKKDGTRFWLEHRARVVEWEGQDAVLSTRVDITERKRSQELKAAFISIVSHELKTPITSLIGAINLLRGIPFADAGGEADELVEIAARNASRLHQLVDDILDIQQIDAGSFNLRPEPTNVRYLVTQAVESNLTFARGFGVSLVTQSCDNVTVLVDPHRFLQVLTNLISNAAKYTRRGDTVTVRAVRNGELVRISVTDHGPGIPEEFRSRIFGRFARVDTAASRAMGSTGLGLSIAKAFAEKMGGSIGFESQPGVATTFFVDMPILKDESHAD